MKTRGYSGLTPHSVNLALAYVVGWGFKYPWPFIHELCAAQAVKPLFGRDSPLASMMCFSSQIALGMSLTVPAVPRDPCLHLQPERER